MKHKIENIKAGNVLKLLGLLMLLASCDTGSRDVGVQTGWYPKVRPDRYFHADFSSQGCKRDVIEISYAGEHLGFVCSWMRKADAISTVRTELYTYSGTFRWAYEEQFKGDERLAHYTIRFAPDGNSYYRLTDGTAGSSIKAYTLEFVDRGTVISKYMSSWNSFRVFEEGVRFLPEDFQLVAGNPLEEFETFHLKKDKKWLDALRSKGVDLATPQKIIAGFVFGEPGTASGWHELKEHECVWVPKAERHGVIGPFPEYCIMTVDFSLESLKEHRALFVELAKKHGGKFMGMSRPPF